MIHVRPFQPIRDSSRPLVWLVSACLAAAPAGGLSSPAADEPAAPPCDRFTLENVRLGMNRSEVEALPLGAIEVVGETTDTLRLEVAGPGRKLQVGLLHNRVQVVEEVFSPDRKRAEKALDDLRARWGEPANPGAPAPKKRGADERPGDVVLSFKWSDRSCQAYGRYHYSRGGLYLALAASPDSIRRFIGD